MRYGDAGRSPPAFRRRALLAGVVAGAVAMAGLLVMRSSGLDLTRGAALALVCVSGAAGLATLALCRASRFGLARLTAALAVAAVVAGWAAAQAPRFLPGMTVTQAAAGMSTLVALVIALCCGLAVLVPSLVLLFALFLRGRLDPPVARAAGAAPGGPPGEAAALSVSVAVPAAGAEAADSAALGRAARGRAGAAGGAARGRAGAAGGAARGRARPLGAAALLGLAAGAGLLVFTDAPWTHVLGVAGLPAVRGGRVRADRDAAR